MDHNNGFSSKKLPSSVRPPAHLPTHSPPPELLAPAGSEECLDAAVENGADAVYFGIAGGAFNARVRAKNIPLEKLGETVGYLHGRGVRAYLTLNTLAFAEELSRVEELLREFARCRVDAVLVQDLGIARLARSLCPLLPLHASTQMSLSSAEALALAATLGIRRVVLPRELSLHQIHLLRRTSGMELEAFVHGALCISFSGQCYASLGLGGRSANRGVCAQPCRMPYTLIDDCGRSAGEPRSAFEQPRRLLSPTDLAALPLLRNLIDAGVGSFKIEGRLKPPEYVAETTRAYRRAIDAIMEERTAVGGREAAPDDGSQRPSPSGHEMNADLARLALTFSRGFSTGWLEGTDPRRLVPGNIASHRGTPLGTVIEVRCDAAVVRLSAPVRRGDGVLFENETEPERSQGGRVYEIFFRRASVKEAGAGEKVLLTFRNGTIDAEAVAEGQPVRKTDDPRLEREALKSLRSRRTETRGIPVAFRIRATVGAPLHVEASLPDGVRCTVVSDAPLDAARKHPLTLETLREQFDRLGGTEFAFGAIEAALDGRAMIPLSVLGTLRKRLIADLRNAVASVPHGEPAAPPLVCGEPLEAIRAALGHGNPKLGTGAEKIPFVYLLFRDAAMFTDARGTLRRCLEAGCAAFYGEFVERAAYETAADAARAVGATFIPVAPRIMKPGETRFLDRIAASGPPAVLVRNLGELAFFRERDIPCVADFSFNVVNDLAWGQMLAFGAERVTPGPDLDSERFAVLLDRIPADRVELIVHGRRALFTAEHCLWKGNLVPPGGRCEKMCRSRPLRLRDRYGAVHTVRPDAHCRNIVENATPMAPAGQLPEWVAQGVGHLRIEWDDRLGFAEPEQAVQSVFEHVRR